MAFCCSTLKIWNMTKNVLNKPTQFHTNHLFNYISGAVELDAHLHTQYWALIKENVDYAHPIFWPYLMHCAPNIWLLPPPPTQNHICLPCYLLCFMDDPFWRLHAWQPVRYLQPFNSVSISDSKSRHVLTFRVKSKVHSALELAFAANRIQNKCDIPHCTAGDWS